MFKSLREKLCCGKAATDDGHDAPSQPVEIAHKANNQVETAPTPSNLKRNVVIDEKPVKRDLWKEAFESLPEDRKEYLRVNDGCSTVDAIENVINTTEQKYKVWMEGGLKIRRQDGNDFNFRDSAVKILNCASQAKDIISKVVSFDPTGHASTAWSIVSLGLTMVQNDIQLRDAVFAASEYLAHTLAYYTLIDTHHRAQNVDSDQNLDNALFGVYSALLDYSAEVNKVREQNVGARVGNSIYAIADRPLEQLKAKVKVKGQSADNWACLSDSLRNRKNAEDILAKIDEAILVNKNIESKVLTAEEERILNWVCTADYSKIQNETQEFRSPNTGNWLFALKEYQDWKISPGDILWLYGVVGCGKSVLCSTVIQDIKRLCEKDSTKSFAYWYFQFSNEMTWSVQNLVRSLIRQLSRKPLAQSVTKMWERNSGRGSQPGWEELRDTLDDLLSTTPGEIFLVLDALDECPERSGRNERKVLLSLLVGLNEHHKDKLHILATSRPEQDIRATLERFPTVDLEAQLAEDVETFVRTEISNGRLREFQDMQNFILDHLVGTRERRFRWADLQITRLEKCNNDDQIKVALQTIPKTLQETYREVLDRIEEKDLNIAREILLFLCLAPVPLDIKAIAKAVSLRSPDRIGKICTTSLVIVSKDGAIRLAHFSVKEYLVDSKYAGNDHRCRFSEDKGHHDLAIKTIDLLLSQKETLTEEIAMSQSFLVYAAKHWGTHVAAAGDVRDIQGKIDRLFTEPTVYFNWLRIAEISKYSSDNPWHKVPKEFEPPIYRASSMGLAHTVETLFAQGSDPLEFFGGHGSDNALTVAAKYNHLNIVELLLGKDHTIEKKSVGGLMQNLHYPSEGKAKLEAILDLIWDLGLLFDESKSPDKVIKEHAICMTIMNDRGGLELMSWLLDRRDEACIPITDEVLQCAICYADFKEEMVGLLFERCNEDIHIGPSFFADLDKHHFALLGDHFGGIDIILTKRANDLPVDDHSVAFWALYASSKGMEWMLRTRPDIRVTEETLIAAASNRFGADMIRLLLDRGEPATQISERILLAAAANHKCPEILRFVLDKLDPAAPMTQTMILTVAEEIVNYTRFGGFKEPEKTFKVVIEELSANTVLTEKACEGLVETGSAMVRLVLDRQQAGFVVSEKMMEIAAALARPDAVELLQLLMSNGGAKIPITEAIVCAAAGNRFRDSSAMEYLFQVQGDSLPITENVLVAATKCPQALELILNRFPEARITDRVFVAAFTERDAMVMLLSRAHNGLPIEAIMIENGKGYYASLGVLELLVDRHLVNIDAWAVETFASRPQHLQLLLSRKPDVIITERALVRAAEDPDSVRLLLNAEKNHGLVTEEVMMAAAKPIFSAKIMRSILHRVESAPLTENVYKEAIFHGNSDTVELILTRRPDLNLKASWEEIWHDVDMSGLKKGYATMVFGELTDFELTESILQDYSYDKEQKDDYGEDSFDDLIYTLCDHGVPIPATEGVGVIVLERCTNRVAKKFLQYRPKLPITDKLSQAVERNPKADKEGLLSLLARKGGSA